MEVIGNHLSFQDVKSVSFLGLSHQIACVLSAHLLETAKRNVSDSDVVIVGYARTPMGAFNGSLASVPAPVLGAAAIKSM
jgi:acetyl-CoA C-acetyltransferase